MSITKELKNTTTIVTSAVGSFAIKVHDKSSKNSFKNEIEENVYVLYTAKHMDAEEITHHLGGMSQSGNCAELYPHIFHVCSGQRVKIETKMMGSDKFFLSVVGEETHKILILNREKRSNSGLYRLKSKKINAKLSNEIDIDPKSMKRFIIYGKQTKDEYKNRLILQEERNQHKDILERKKGIIKMKEDKKENNRKFVKEVILKATPSTSVQVGLNLGANLGANFGFNTNRDDKKDDKEGKEDKKDKEGKEVKEGRIDVKKEKKEGIEDKKYGKEDKKDGKKEYKKNETKKHQEKYDDHSNEEDDINDLNQNSL